MVLCLCTSNQHNLFGASLDLLRFMFKVVFSHAPFSCRKIWDSMSLCAYDTCKIVNLVYCLRQQTLILLCNLSNGVLYIPVLAKLLQYNFSYYSNFLCLWLIIIYPHPKMFLHAVLFVHVHSVFNFHIMHLISFL
jgi:hypothetical protein